MTIMDRKIRGENQAAIEGWVQQLQAERRCASFAMVLDINMANALTIPYVTIANVVGIKQCFALPRRD